MRSLAESNAGPVEHFLFPYLTEPSTHGRTSSVLGSIPALRSSVIARLRFGISSVWVTRTAPCTTAFLSSIRIPETRLTPSSVRGVTLRLSLDLTIGGRTTSTTSHITCSRQSARRNKCLCSLNSLPSSHLSMGNGPLRQDSVVVPSTRIKMSKKEFAHFYPWRWYHYITSNSGTNKPVIWCHDSDEQIPQLHYHKSINTCLNIWKISLYF
jgi:hypothetical protein